MAQLFVRLSPIKMQIRVRERQHSPYNKYSVSEDVSGSGVKMEKVFNIKRKSKIQSPENSQKVFLISSAKERTLISEIDDIHLASYFQPYINFCYYILIAPFKIEFTSADANTYRIRTNPIQKILCGIIQPIICLNALLEFRSEFIGKVRQSPEIFMRAIDQGSSTLMCFVFFYTIWLKKDLVLALCNHSIPSHKNKTVNRRVTFSLVVLLTFSTIAYMTYVFLIKAKGNTYNIQYGFCKSVQKYRFQYYFTQALEKADECEDLSTLTILGTTIAMLLRFYKWILWDFVTALPLMTGFVVYKVSKKFRSIMIQFLDGTVQEDAQVFEVYSRTKLIFHKLNVFIGPICMVVFLITTTYSAVSILDVTDSDTWISPIITTIYIILSFLSMAFSAEAHYQASYFKTWLLAHPRRSFTNFLFEADQCNLAIRGDRFFTVTYSFLGTTISAVLTLTIFMIQFSGNQNSTSLPG